MIVKIEISRRDEVLYKQGCNPFKGLHPCIFTNTTILITHQQGFGEFAVGFPNPAGYVQGTGGQKHSENS